MVFKVKFQKAVAGLLLLLFVCGIFGANMKGASGEFSASQKNIFVPRDYATIQEAINAAEENSVIYVSASVYNEHIVINKSISLIGENWETTIINGSIPEKNVVLIKANNVYVSGFTTQHGDTGIFGDSVSNCTIKGNCMKDSYNGIFLNNSRNCHVQENTVINNTWRGIFLSFSQDSIVTENVVLNNGWYGINFNASRNCIASRNIVGNHKHWDGLGLQKATNCVLSLNNVYNNFRGVWVDASDNCLIYNNNIFLNNTYRARVTPDSHNIVWDIGYPGGGNFWGDYVGLDRYSGVYQNESGSDAIGDAAYENEAHDRYPLIKPINFFDLGFWNNQAYFATTISNSTISNFTFSPEDKIVSFNVTGKENTKGFCRVGIPRDVLWASKVEDWRVLLDYVEDITVNCRIYQDEDFTYIYIPYNHTMHIIQVKGTDAIPEFSNHYLFVLLLLLTVAATVLKKRRSCTLS